MTINVGLGTGGKAQQFAQVMALANTQLLAGGKTHLVGDRELYNTATELTKIMGYKNPDRFFCDPTAVKALMEAAITGRDCPR